MEKNEKNKRAAVIFGVILIFMMGFLVMKNSETPDMPIQEQDTAIHASTSKKEISEKPQQPQQTPQQNQEKEQAKQHAQEIITNTLNGLTKSYDQVEHITWFSKEIGNQNDYVSYYIGKNDGSDSYFVRIIAGYIRKAEPGTMGPSIKYITFSSSLGKRSIENTERLESGKHLRIKGDNLEERQVRVGYSLHSTYFDVSYKDVSDCVRFLANGNTPVLRWYDSLHNENHDYYLSQYDIDSMKEAIEFANAVETLK